MQNVSLESISKNLFQNNPVGIKGNLMLMRLVDASFEPTHENFVALLATLPQDVAVLTQVIQKAFTVNVDSHKQSASWLNNVQLEAGVPIGYVAANVFQQSLNAATKTTAAKNTEGVGVEAGSQKNFSLTTESKQLTVWGWILVLLLIAGIAGGVGVSWKVISKAFKNS